MSYVKPSVRMFRYTVLIAGGGNIRMTLEAKSRANAEIYASLTAMKLWPDCTPTMILTDRVTQSRWHYTPKTRGNGNMWRPL